MNSNRICKVSERRIQNFTKDNSGRESTPGVFLFYANNEPKSVLARDLGDCRDNLRNSRSVFLIVYANYVNIIIKRRIMTEE